MDHNSLGNVDEHNLTEMWTQQVKQLVDAVEKNKSEDRNAGEKQDDGGSQFLDVFILSDQLLVLGSYLSIISLYTYTIYPLSVRKLLLMCNVATLQTDNGYSVWKYVFALC